MEVEWDRKDSAIIDSRRCALLDWPSFILRAGLYADLVLNFWSFFFRLFWFNMIFFNNLKNNNSSVPSVSLFISEIDTASIEVKNI